MDVTGTSRHLDNVYRAAWLRCRRATIPGTVTIDAPGAPPAARPWRTIWLSPRRTMRAILDGELRPTWVPVVGLASLNGALATIAVTLAEVQRFSILWPSAAWCCS